MSAWEQYLATTDGDGVQIHQYAPADIRADRDGSSIRLGIETAYPWDGGVSVRVLETPEGPWTLSLRIPPNGRAVTVVGPDGRIAPGGPGSGSVELHRAWRAGDTVTLGMDLPPLSVLSDPRVDATRGCVAFERGPLVYCVETADIPAGEELESVRVAADVVPTVVPRDDLGPSFVGLAIPATIARDAGATTGEDITVGAIPYFAWANRRVEAMRVWVPTTPTADQADQDGTGSDPAAVSRASRP